MKAMSPTDPNPRASRFTVSITFGIILADPPGSWSVLPFPTTMYFPEET
jgi:hypothetical protein